MRKQILSLLTLLIGVVAAYAQPGGWNYVGDNAYSGECVVYAKLVDADGQAVDAIDGSWIGAFIDGDCRGVAEAAYYRLASESTDFYYFAIRIKGSAADDGKTITWKYADSSNMIYTVTGKDLTYENNATTGGTPSDLFPLTFVQPTTKTTFPDTIRVKVGESVDLMTLVNWVPANASHPENASWIVGDTTIASVSGSVLTGVKPSLTGTTIRSYMGAFSQNGFYATVQVIQPITGMTLKDKYAKGDTVYVADANALKAIMRDCYTITPADANEPLAWTWSPEDLIRYDYISEDSINWWPEKPGVATMTLMGGNYSVSLPITILNKVTSITPLAYDLNVHVGDTLSSLLPYSYKLVPSEGIDDRVEYIIHEEQGAPGVLRKEADGSVIAAKSGYGNLEIRSVDNPQLSHWVSVAVRPKVTSLSVNLDPLTLTKPVNQDTVNVTSLLMDNLAFSPQQPLASEIEISVPDNSVLTVGVDTDANPQIDALALGTTKVTVRYKDNHSEIVDGKLTLTKTELADSFTVHVVSGITAFTFDAVSMGDKDTYTLVLTPDPVTAKFDAKAVSLKITGSQYADVWTLADVDAANDSGLRWIVTPRSVGQGNIVVYYEGIEFGHNTLTIGQTITQKEGWTWLSPYAATISINSIYGDVLEEARSQTALVYNDAKYGYFGGLTDMELAGCYKVKVKEGKYVATFAPYDPATNAYSGSAKEIGYGAQWNWMGTPYQYKHVLTDVLANYSANAGDRIISKDDGFAEYGADGWTGTLTTIGGGEGYMFYRANDTGVVLMFPGEAKLGQPSTQNGTRSFAPRATVWQYNSADYADNMTIVADLGAGFTADHLSVGAFVGDECRGEGMMIGGKCFITVAGEKGENVSFRLYDGATGEYRAIEGTRPFQPIDGTLTAPLRLHVGGMATAISTLTGDATAEAPQVYTLDGKRVSGKPVPGVYIVRQNGNTRKVVVK